VSLKDGIVPPQPDPTLAAMDTTREQQTVPDGPELVKVRLTTAPGPAPDLGLA
jgi:hypothetical protein